MAGSAALAELAAGDAAGPAEPRSHQWWLQTNFILKFETPPEAAACRVCSVSYPSQQKPTGTYWLLLPNYFLFACLEFLLSAQQQ